MSMSHVAIYWRRGCRVLAAMIASFFMINLLYFAVDETLPDNPWLKFTVATLLLLLLGPFIAWHTVQLAFRNRDSRRSLPTVAVATFSDEPSAHIAASILDQSGISAVVSSGSMGSQTGLPIPAGSIRLLVSTLDRTKAELVLASARDPAARQ
jgi:hypothetical protein